MRFMSIPALLTVNQEEWTMHEASNAILPRIISERLMRGESIEQQLDVSINGISKEDLSMYLREYIAHDYF